MSETKQLVGVVGVGRMGIAMVRHLARRGTNTIVYDLSEAACDVARALGAELAPDPAGVAARSRFVIIAVGYDEEATEVLLGARGLLQTMQAGGIVAISSTCTPDHVRWLRDRAAEHDIAIVDAPICRGQRAADDGTLLALVGADDAPFAVARPIYECFCADVILLGPVGAGQFGKALNNFLLWVNGIALIEAGRLTEANGLDLVKLRSALLIGSGASDALKNWDNVSFLWALKDMQIVSKMADAAGLSMPIAGAIKELVKEGRRIKQGTPPDWTGRQRAGR